MSTGIDAATAAADLTLACSDLMAAVDAIRLSRRALAAINTNLLGHSRTATFRRR